MEGLTLGVRSFINYGCFFDLGAPTSIGADVQVGYETMFITCSHGPGPASRRAGSATTSPITIGDGCWIGARAIILPGVTIAPGTVVAAGSVVTSDIALPGVYAGMPARLRRPLAD
jgi:maltose O-acetyltransferase